MKVSNVSQFPRIPREEPKQLPHDISLEQALLGAVLHNEQVMQLVGSFLESDHFFEPAHKEIYRLYKMMQVSERKITVTTLRPYLAVGDVAGMPIAQYVARLAAEATTVINAPFYAREIIELSRRRRLIEIAQDIELSARGAGPDTTAERQIEAIDEALHELRDEVSAANDDSTTLQTGVSRLVARAQDFQQGKKEDIPSTGFADLDRALGGGFRPGRLIVFAGRPAMGKSVLLASSARRTARRQEGRFGALINSLELDVDEVSARIVADEMSSGSTPIAYRDILHGNLDPAQFENVQRAQERLASLPVKIDASSAITIHQIESRARLYRDRMEAANKRLGVIFIDYLGLIRPTDRYRGSRVDEAGEIASGCKNMAKRYGVCVVLFSQLNRSVESRDDKRPNMADLRDSGNIEEHADVVGLLYRPAYYLQRSPKMKQGDPLAYAEMIDKQYLLEINLDKNRLGPPTTVKLHCNVAYSSVDNARDF